MACGCPPHVGLIPGPGSWPGNINLARSGPRGASLPCSGFGISGAWVAVVLLALLGCFCPGSGPLDSTDVSDCSTQACGAVEASVPSSYAPPGG